MIAYDTAARFPTYAFIVPGIVNEDDFDVGQTEHGMLQERGGLTRLNAFRGEDWEVTDTASDYATFFAVVSSCGADALQNAVVSWDEQAQPDRYETEARAEVGFGDTVDQPSKWMLASQSRMSPTFRLMAHLASLFETPEDSRWPSTAWPIESAFDDARAFISRLPLAHIPEPEIRFADDGEINFLWIVEKVHIDLGFYGTGTYSYFGHDGEGQEIQDENVLASEGLAQAIKNLLTA